MLSLAPQSCSLSKIAFSQSGTAIHSHVQLMFHPLCCMHIWRRFSDLNWVVYSCFNVVTIQCHSKGHLFNHWTSHSITCAIPLNCQDISSQYSKYFVVIFKIFPLQKSQGVWSPLAQHTWNEKTWWWKWRINDKDGIKIEW